MTQAPVLVFGANRRDRIVKALHHVGLDPLVRETMKKALDEIVPGRFSAVCISPYDASAAPLEFVLNVRDLDERVPIIVAGRRGYERYEQMLVSQPRVFRITGTAGELGKQLIALLEDHQTSDVTSP